ncbi:MAG: GxGYxYP family putative glycoside hydrolase [Planctomycetota bacterium]|nr:GxGYxYP family putative glycoside hydrolase [Planctomycetota bacterium]
MKKLLGCVVAVLAYTSLSMAGYDIGKSEMVEPVWPSMTAKSLFPRSKKPADTVYVLDIRGLDYNDIALATTAQGIINKDVPHLYIYIPKPSQTAATSENLAICNDEKWLTWLVKEKYLKKTQKINSLKEAIEKWQIKKVVVLDPQMPGSFNIATMVAGVEGMPVAYPEHIKKYNLQIGVDLRGKFKTNIEAYQWVFDNYWPKMDHTVLAWISPQKNFCHLRDYLVAKKIFTLWVTGRVDGNNVPSANPKEEEKFFRQLLAKMPVNIPVLGFPWAGDGVGIGEQEGVAIMGCSGKFLTCCDWKSNLSVWTGIESKQQSYKQKPMRNIKLENAKIYAALVMSDGDNLNTWIDYFYPFWEDKQHGQIPIGWTLGPALIDLQAPLVDYYYDGLTNTDSFGCAVSGIGYILPETFGYDFKPQQREKVWRQYGEITGKYMKKLDMNWVHIARFGTPVKDIPYEKYAAIDAVKSIFSDYGGYLPYEQTLYQVGGKTVCHALKDDQIKELDKLKTPAFVYIFLYNWGFSSYDKVREFTNTLPKNVVLVRPDELMYLYKQSKNGKK